MVDYLLLNIHDLQFITNFEILQPNEFSDCGIKIHIKSKQNQISSNSNMDSEMYFKWDEINIQSFKDLISNNQNLINDITSSIETSDTDQVVEQFTSIIKDHAFNIFGKHVIIMSQSQNKRFLIKNNGLIMNAIMHEYNIRSLETPILKIKLTKIVSCL